MVKRGRKRVREEQEAPMKGDPSKVSKPLLHYLNKEVEKVAQEKERKEAPTT